jgi:subtilisin family serine protease
VLVALRSDGARAAALTEGVSILDTLDVRGLAQARGEPGVVGFVLQVPPGAEWATIEQLRAHPDVIYAEPNGYVYAAAPARQTSVPTADEMLAVDDTLYDSQWYLQRINASRSWALAQGTTQTPVRVAVVDSGVNFAHPDLAGRLLPGWNVISNGATAPVDDYGHGSHVSGLLGAITNNGKGMAGVAAPVQIDPYKALDDRGSGTYENVATAIYRATDAGARILNLSLEVSSDIATIRFAIYYAVSKGVLPIAASGNLAGPVKYPAAYPGVLAVGATDYLDQVPYYSSRGPDLDLVAPGGTAEDDRRILSAWSALPGALCRGTAPAQVVDGGHFCATYGTSMATALVSGAAALV